MLRHVATTVAMVVLFASACAPDDGDLGSRKDSTQEQSNTVLVGGTLSGAAGTHTGDEEWQKLIPLPSPLDDLRLSEGDKERLYETWQAAMSSCMRAKGFEIDISSYDATAGSRSIIRTPIEPAMVAQYGYHRPPDTAQPEPMGPNERRAQQDPAFMEALFGSDSSSRDGCRGEQFDLVYDEGGIFWQLDQQIGNAQVELSIALDASTKVQELDAAWSACMLARGFEYEAPDRPASLFAGATTVTEMEIVTRQADIDCQLETRYVETTSGWLADDVKAWLDANAQTVDDYLALKDDYLRNLNGIRSSLALD